MKFNNIDTSKSNLRIKQHKREKSLRKTIMDKRKSYNIDIASNVDLVIGIDNGATGSIASWIVNDNIIDFIETPSKHELNYQKEISYIDRIDFSKLKTWIESKIEYTKILYQRDIKCLVVMERPMVNPQRFESSLNAVRAFESVLIILNLLNLSYLIIDSKKWQHHFFGKNTMMIDLKNSSYKLGNQFLETYKEFNLNTYTNMISINKRHGDADGLLITRYAIEKLIKN